MPEVTVVLTREHAERWGTDHVAAHHRAQRARLARELATSVKVPGPNRFALLMRTMTGERQAPRRRGYNGV